MGRELALQGLGLGADDDAPARRGAVEGGRKEVGEALPTAGAGLEKAHAAGGEDIAGGGCKPELAFAAAEAGHAGGEAGRTVGVRRAQL